MKFFVLYRNLTGPFGIIVIMSLLRFHGCVETSTRSKSVVQIQNSDSLSEPIKIDSAEILNKLYRNAVEGDRKDSIEFFAGFPSRPDIFHDIYGFQEDTFHPLYRESHLHIQLLCDLDKIIDSNDYYEKLILLSIGVKWQADAVAHLQHCIHEKLDSESTDLIEKLSTFERSDIISFWQFVFDGPGRPYSLSEEYLNVINSKNRVAYESILTVQNKTEDD